MNRFILFFFLFGSAAEASVSDRLQVLEMQIQDLENYREELRQELNRSSHRAIIASVCDGRLTTESGVPISTSDQSNKGTLYFTPYHGSLVSLYNGTTWLVHQFSEVSLALSGLTSGANYDVFLYDNAGTLTLELTAWTNDTTRATALTLQNGVYVKNGATGRRYLGTIRTTATNATEDSATKRFVWNYWHRVPRTLLIQESTATWTYNSTTVRSANNSAANRVYLVIGINEVAVSGTALLIHTNATTAKYEWASPGFGIDSTSTSSALMGGAASFTAGTSDIKVQSWAFYVGYPGIGYHYIQWTENCCGFEGETVTFYGQNNTYGLQSGMTIEYEG